MRLPGGGGSHISMAISGAMFAIVGWIIIGQLGLTGPMQTVVRSLFMGIVVSIMGLGQYWLQKRSQRKPAGEGQAAGAAPDQDINFFIKAAEQRLASSPLGAEAKLSTLPVVFLLGASGSAKTSTLVHSGIEPDLLAGQVYQDSLIIPTGSVNLWLAQRSVFVEAGGKLLGDRESWIHLIKKTQPPKLRSLFSRGKQAPRAAVACIDGEMLLKSGAEDALNTLARNLNARLGEISQTLGIRLPVYVLITRVDRMGYFGDFVANLSDEESTQVVGSTLPIRDNIAAGVYAEEESKRLTAAFNELFFSLCDKRLPMLEREHDAEKQPAVYEFPREFRKLRNLLVKFLGDVGRPSQLHASPFLRGFYFSGVRPKVVKETALSPTSPGTQSFGRGSLGMSDDPLGLDGPKQPQQKVQSVRTRRVPQWIFLGHLFSSVILKDRAAQGASGSSARTELMRRILMMGACGLLFFWAIAMTSSYFGNRALEQKVIQATRGIGAGEGGGASEGLPSVDALRRLDTLRESVELLSRYEQEGAPWALRWGLYVGSDMYPSARKIYFNRFHKLLFGATQTSLLAWLKKLPDRPGPTDEYRPSYDTLKGYLITTSHPDKSTRQFLSPLLSERWAANRPIDQERAALARRQFDFYADELRIANPFSKENDAEAIERARYYLSQFNAAESIYQFMLAEASRQKPGVNFNKQFPGSASYVVNNRDVTGAFTADGWKFMQEAIRNLKRFFGGEQWVLGEKAYGDLDPSKLEPILRDRYHKDFIGNWRQYLANSQVVRFGSIADAAQKLGQLSGNSSFLLTLFCVASNHTSAATVEEVKAPYQPLHFVEPSPCTDRYVQPNNQPYVSALVGLQAAMDRVAKTTGNEIPEDLVNATLNEATNAYRVTRTIAQQFRVDRDGNVHGMVQKLMEDPIRYAEGVLGNLGPKQLNSAGGSFCRDFAKLSSKYPFNTASRSDATMEEVNSILNPSAGRLEMLYQQHLKPHIEKQGGQWIRKADSRINITPAFLNYFNRIMALRDAMYREGGNDPKLAYNMRALQAEGLRGVTLTLDGQTLKASGKGGEARDFTWPGGSARGANLSGNMGGGDLGFIVYDALWAAFRFFGDADRFAESGNTYRLEWVPRQGQSGQPMTISGGKPLTIPFQLDLKGAPPIFRKGYLSSLNCVSEVAR